MFKNLREVILDKKGRFDRGIHFIATLENKNYFTYGEIYEKAIQLYAIFRKNGVKAQDQVILQVSADYDFVSIFWACLIGKMIPVPLTTNNHEENNKKVINVLNTLDHPVIVTDSKRMKEINEFLKNGPIDKEVLLINIHETLDDILPVDEEQVRMENCEEEELAFIQFSSGSTGIPKGVRISHKNIMSNIESMMKGSNIVDDDIMFSWVPLTHNLGLVVSHLLGTVCHLNAYLMKTELFLYSPQVWMEKMSEYKATLTCSPNFGYQLYLNSLKYHKPDNLDLSHIRLICNGAEPISEQICDKFLEVLKPFGLHDTVYQTAYGLAEATVSVSSSIPGKALKSVMIDGNNQVVGNQVVYIDDSKQNKFALKLITVGIPHHNVEVRMANEEQSFGEDVFGEVQIKSRIVTEGYYGNEELSNQLYTKDGWLKTGDIGFLHNGFLYICGRVKDIIFINGKNYYSNDIERLLYQVDPLKEYCVVGEYDQDSSRDMIIAFVKVDLAADTYDFKKFSINLKESVMKASGVVLDEVIQVSEIPKTTSGKIQRFKLKDYYMAIKAEKSLKDEQKDVTDKTEKIQIKQCNISAKQEMIKRIRQIISDIVGFPVEDIHRSLLEYGISSVKVAELNQQLQDITKRKITSSLVYEYPTIDKIADFCLEDEQEVYDTLDTFVKEDVAIIGMGCKFPGNINHPEDLWKALLDGTCVITEIPETRQTIYQYAKERNRKLYGGFLEDIEYFDANKFHITPVEAKMMDPQQRLLLEVTDQALQNAGIEPEKTRENQVGVFVSGGSNDYMELINEKVQLDKINSYMLSGNMSSISAGRIGYLYDWHGPMMVVDTACSSSLVAMHQAILSLNNGECRMAVVAGANVILSPRGYAGLIQMNALSESGKCKTFDEDADGYVRSEGAAAIILKKYSDAVRDKDSILCVIKGSAINHDGKSNGLTAPNGVAQTNVVRAAIKKANIKPEDIYYIETHGTGTKLGDPIEVNALNKVFNQEEKIYLGSVKSNLGHTEGVAGLASVVKAVLMLKYGVIPKKINFTKPNSLISWKEMPFVINDENIPWNKTKTARTIGISSFGLSGTNVHVILQQYLRDVGKEEVSENEQNRLFIISARGKELLAKDISIYRTYLSESKDNFTDICSAVLRARTEEKYKYYEVAKTKSELVDKLAKYENSLSQPWYTTWKKAPIIMILFGAYQDTIAMIRDMYKTNDLCRSYLEECNEICRKQFDLDIIEVISKKKTLEKEIGALLPVILEYSLVMTLIRMGIVPKQLVGKNMSKYVLEIISKKFTLAEGLERAYEDTLNKSEHQFMYLNFKEEGVIDCFETKVNSLEIGLGEEHTIVAIGMNAHSDVEILKQEKQLLLISTYDDWLEAIGKLEVSGYEIDFCYSEHRWKGIGIPERTQNKKIYWYE